MGKVLQGKSFPYFTIIATIKKRSRVNHALVADTRADW